MPFDTRKVSEKSKAVRECIISVEAKLESTCSLATGEPHELEIVKLTVAFSFEDGEHAQFFRTYICNYEDERQNLVDDIAGIYILATNKPNGKFYFSKTDPSKVEIVKQGDWRVCWGVVLWWGYDGSNKYPYITIEQEPIGYLLNQSDLMELGKKLYKGETEIQ